MIGHMRISALLCLCGWVAVAGVAAEAVGAGGQALGAGQPAGPGREAPGAGGAGLDKDFEMLFGAAGGHPKDRVAAVAPSNRKPKGAGGLGVAGRTPGFVPAVTPGRGGQAT